MSKKTIVEAEETVTEVPRATAPTEPPPFIPIEITIIDEDGILDTLRTAGVTATRDTSPGVIVTLDKPVRVFAGDKIVVDAPGKWHVEKLNA